MGSDLRAASWANPEGCLILPWPQQKQQRLKRYYFCNDKCTVYVNKVTSSGSILSTKQVYYVIRIVQFSLDCFIRHSNTDEHVTLGGRTATDLR